MIILIQGSIKKQGFKTLKIKPKYYIWRSGGGVEIFK